MKERLIVNLDYCGTCRGTCPTCVLTLDERLSTKPLMQTDDIVSAFTDIFSHYGTSFKRFVVGFGRGNHLVLGGETIDDILDVVDFIENQVVSEEMLIEVSTSLVGKIDKQIQRAIQIIEAAKRRGLRADFRFVVVANVGVSSHKYWQNVVKFMDALIEYRGGNYSGTGDIIQINLALNDLPELSSLKDTVFKYRSPLNIAWVPAFDKDAGNAAQRDKLEEWLAVFYESGEENGLDTNISNWGNRSIKFKEYSVSEFDAQISVSGDTLLYVSTDGSYHYGYPTIMADMDPVRFDPLSIKDGNLRQSSISNDKDYMSLLRHRGCRECPYFTSCVHSGGYRIALIAARNAAKKSNMCLSGLRSAFGKMDNKNV